MRMEHDALRLRKRALKEAENVNELDFNIFKELLMKLQIYCI